MKVYGNGERDGEVEQWLNRGQGELDVQLMDIVIDFTHQHYMQI